MLDGNVTYYFSISYNNSSSAEDKLLHKKKSFHVSSRLSTKSPPVIVVLPASKGTQLSKLQSFLAAKPAMPSANARNDDDNDR